MSETKISNNIYVLRKEIQQIQSELSSLGDPITDMPEMISSANLLRSNEYLLKSDQKKTDLISLYARYSSSMELLLSAVFEIQHELKDILQTQSSMIVTSSNQNLNSKSKPKSKSKSKSKSKPKSKPKSKSKSNQI